MCAILSSVQGNERKKDGKVKTGIPTLEHSLGRYKTRREAKNRENRWLDIHGSEWIYKEGKMRNPVCGLSDNAQTGFLISLYCFHCSSDPHGGIVSHYGEWRSRRRFGKRRIGLSTSRPLAADHHRTNPPSVRR